jgi:hypothetical protein
MELPGWDDDIGYQVNLFWAEMVQRERRQTAAGATFAAVLSLAAGSSADVGDKLEGMNPFLDDFLSKSDHTAYTLDNKVEKILAKLRAVMVKKAEFDRMRWIASDDFSIEEWLKE